MTKLAKILRHLESLNENGEYSIGLAQDIHMARQEVKQLYHLAYASAEREWIFITKDDERLIRDIAEDFGNEN